MASYLLLSVFYHSFWLFILHNEWLEKDSMVWGVSVGFGVEYPSWEKEKNKLRHFPFLFRLAPPVRICDNSAAGASE
jgi:hypothetical protein